jgi:hypothetical protein
MNPTLDGELGSAFLVGAFGILASVAAALQSRNYFIAQNLEATTHIVVFRFLE